ncbi:DNA repair protein RadC [bacterium]|nr:DNA repair protein RadC [bacterium]
MDRNGAFKSTIKDWPEADRPREKMIKYGSSVLSDAELVALLIGSGTRGVSAIDLARRIITLYTGLSKMAACTAGELLKVKGVGPAAVAKIMAAFEIGRRVEAGSYSKGKKITCVEDVVAYYRPLTRDLKKEVFRVVLLDSGNSVIRESIITEGILNASLVHPREVFKVAVDYGAASIIAIHNHPSGNENPSNNDYKVTEQLVKAGKIMGIPLTDHIIIAGKGFYSFAKQGLI